MGTTLIWAVVTLIWVVAALMWTVPNMAAARQVDGLLARRPRPQRPAAPPARLPRGVFWPLHPVRPREPM
eukprot:3626213-Prymnesium_polylepis.1